MTGRSKKDLAHFAMAELGIRVLTPAYHILLDLNERGSSTSGDLLANCQLTPATFQKYLADLVARDMIWWKKDPSDTRRHRYHLADGTRQVLNEELQFPARWQPNATADRSEQALETFIVRMRERLKIRIFSNEFQILLMLYDKGLLTTGQLLALIDASPGVFYIALRRLTDLRHIRELPDPADGRQKLNHLTDQARDILDQIHLELREWSLRLPEGTD